MKWFCLLTAGFSLLLYSQPLMAQDSLSTPLPSAFSRGNWSFNLMRDIQYSHFKQLDQDDNKQGETTNFDFSTRATYFFGKGLGVGWNIQYSQDKNDYSNKIVSTDYSLGAHFTWGTTLSSKFNFYVSPQISYNSQKDKITQSNGTINEEMADGWEYGATIGFPIRLCNRNTYLTPKFSYNHLTLDYPDGTQTESGFNAGVMLQTYLPHDQFHCGSYGKTYDYGEMYDKGSWWIEFPTKGYYSNGNTELDFDNSTPDQKFNWTGLYVGVNTGYEIRDNIGVGFKTSYRNRVNEDEESKYKTTNNSFDIGPTLTFNAPFDDWKQHFFFQAGATWGSSNLKYEYNSNVTENKDKTSFYYGALGYNFPLAVRVSFPFYFLYSCEKLTSKENDQSTTNQGYGVYGGIRFTF